MGELVDNKIENHTAKFVCPICKDPLSVPQSIIKCKHTFCYTCLKNWFINSIKSSNLRCPLCREIVDSEPFNNKILQSVIISFYTLFFEEDTKEGKKQLYFQRLGSDKREFEVDLKNKNLFEENFNTTGVGIVDMDDGGVMRCSSCHWEIEANDDEDEDQTECPHCGVTFRGVDHAEIRRRKIEAGEISEDDGESINTEGERSDDLGLHPEEEEENSDLDGFIIDELDESENGSESDSSLNSDYYEFNSDDDILKEKEEHNNSDKEKTKKKREIILDLSDDEEEEEENKDIISDNDDDEIEILEDKKKSKKRKRSEKKDKKEKHKHKKHRPKKTIIIDDEEEDE